VDESSPFFVHACHHINPPGDWTSQVANLYYMLLKFQKNSSGKFGNVKNLFYIYIMKTARMTGKDYRRELNLIRQSENSLIAHLTERVIELGTIHPNAIIAKIGDTEIKATCLTKQWVDTLKPIEKIEIVETIEKWSSELQNTKQLEIKE